MEEAPDHFESRADDEPTQPYTRRAIESVHRLAVVPTQADEGWFEFGGRRIRISLLALAHIGSSGTPATMINCGRSNLVSGEIARDNDAPSFPRARLTSVHPSPPPRPGIDDSENVVRSRASWPGWAVAGALAVALVLLLASRSEDPATADGAGAPVEPSPAPPPVTNPPIVASPPVVASSPPVITPPAPPAPAPAKTKSEAATSACATQRRSASDALHGGRWSDLDILAKRTKCWSKTNEPKLLRMRALFELERYEECVALAKRVRSKEAGLWQKNCSRALQ